MGLTITRVETTRLNVTERGGWLFVQLFTDDDLVGSGEASQTGEDDAVERLLLDSLAPRLLGKDPRDAALLGVQLDEHVVARYGQRQARTLDQR